MTDNCKPQFTFNDKLPPMTKKVEVVDDTTEKKALPVKKPKKKRRKRRNLKDVKWKAVERNYR